MDEAVGRVGARAELPARGVPDPYRRPVVGGRDVDDWRGTVDAAAVQPIGVIDHDYSVIDDPPDHRDMAQTQPPGPFEGKHRSDRGPGAAPVAALGGPPPQRSATRSTHRRGSGYPRPRAHRARIGSARTASGCAPAVRCRLAAPARPCRRRVASCPVICPGPPSRRQGRTRAPRHPRSPNGVHHRVMPVSCRSSPLDRERGYRLDVNLRSPRRGINRSIHWRNSLCVWNKAPPRRSGGEIGDFPRPCPAM